MKLLRLFFIVPLLLGFQCEDDILSTEDILIETGLLGRWEIADESINGISDLTPKCCRFFEFLQDNNAMDDRGLFIFTDSQNLENTGTFTVDETNQIIYLVDDDEDEFVIAYLLDNSQQNLTLTFTENGDEFVQGWVRAD